MSERNTALRVVAEGTRASSKYTYNYDYLPPLAMVDALSPAEEFAARPDWIFQFSVSALRILFNSIMVGVKNKGDNVELVVRRNQGSDNPVDSGGLVGQTDLRRRCTLRRLSTNNRFAGNAD